MQLKAFLGIAITVIGIIMTIYAGYLYVSIPESSTDVIASEMNNDDYCIELFFIMGIVFLVGGISIIINHKNIVEV